MFSILPSTPRFHGRECRCALLPAVANKVPLSSFPWWSPEGRWNRTGYRPVLGFWVERISIFTTEWQAFCHLRVVSLLLWQQTSWNVHQNLIKLIYAIIYRFTFTKTLYKNWISWYIIRFNAISVMLYNQPMGSYFAVHSTLTDDFHSTHSEAKKGSFLFLVFFSKLNLLLCAWLEFQKIHQSAPENSWQSRLFSSILFTFFSKNDFSSLFPPQNTFIQVNWTLFKRRLVGYISETPYSEGQLEGPS